MTTTTLLRQGSRVLRRLSSGETYVLDEAEVCESSPLPFADVWALTHGLISLDDINCDWSARREDDDA